jgi:hypothetical protein
MRSLSCCTAHCPDPGGTSWKEIAAYLNRDASVAHAQLGDMEPAVQWLRTAADTGFPCLRWFERDPLLAPARQHQSFGELLTYVRHRRDSSLRDAY